MGLVHRATGDNHAELAFEEELQRDYPTTSSARSPVGARCCGRPCYVDPKFMGHDTVVSAAGSADVSLRARTEELCRVEDATVAPLVHEPNDKEWDIPDA